MKPYLLISACLLGERCRYDGESKPLDEDILQKLNEKYTLLPVCPEKAGGLPAPRVPAERRGDRVVNRNGADVTDNYRRGAGEALALARRYNCKIALFKERSPSCGAGKIYDGTFSGKLTEGYGVSAEALISNGINVVGGK